jgi:TolB-like protein
MAVLYVVAAWLIMQVAEVLKDLANLPDWIGPAVLGLLALGFPIALVFSWFYELTPEGLALEKDIDRAESITHITGRRLDFIVIALLSAAVIVFAYDKWWTPPPPAKSIAVLAFENMSGDPEQEYFSDGISEELLNALAEIPELTVISRSSSFSFKGKEIAISKVAEQLNVAHVLDGSVRKFGDRVRITAQLIDAKSDSHLWSESYDRELDDIFTVQEEIAGAISDALKLRLELVTEQPVLPTVIKAASTNAYDAYLRGRELIHRRDRDSLMEAIRYLEHAVRLDESFAPAHAQLAIALTLTAPTVEEASRKAVPHLNRAQALEPNLAEAHGGRALLANLAGDPESTIEHAKKALATNPNYADALYWLHTALGTGLGRWGEAIAALETVLVIDPLSTVGRYTYTATLAIRGRFEDAHKLADEIIAQNSALGHSAHAWITLFYEGKVAEGLSWALKTLAAGIENRGDYTASETYTGGAFIYRVRAFIWVGEFEEARRVDSELAFMVDIAERRFNEAIQATQKRLQLEPDNERAIAAAANALYAAGRINDALPLYERMRRFAVEGQPIGMRSWDMGVSPWEQTMRLALARRQAGDEDGAQAAARIVRRNQAAFRAEGLQWVVTHRTEAVLAAFEHDPDRVVAALKLALQRPDPLFFDDPIFEEVRSDPRFVGIRQELDDILAAEHIKVLQLICFNNPACDHWQPLLETCEGVDERRRT